MEVCNQAIVAVAVYDVCAALLVRRSVRSLKPSRELKAVSLKPPGPYVSLNQEGPVLPSMGFSVSSTRMVKPPSPRGSIMLIASRTRFDVGSTGVLLDLLRLIHAARKPLRLRKLHYMPGGASQRSYSHERRRVTLTLQCATIEILYFTQKCRRGASRFTAARAQQAHLHV